LEGARSALVTARRFPPPWSVEEQIACFIVHDHNRQKLAFVCAKPDPVPRD
jgi:hypothetical protein